MSERIIYQQPSGIAAIVVPAPGFSVADVMKDVPEGVAHAVIDSDDLPQDRTFRNAWVADTTGAAVSVDMPKARNLWRDKLRTERAARLIELDGLYLKALEESNAAELLRIAQLKQALRDAPADPRIEAATTPEQLKLITLPA